MLSNGQIEVRKIINSFLEEYENLQKEYKKLQEKNTTDTEEKIKEFNNKRYNFYKRVRNAFCSNDIIKNDSVTSQPLGTSRYSKNYLQWLAENGVKEEIELNLDEGFTEIDFPMREILYDRDRNLEPAYMGGAKWNSTISCLFGLAQGKRLNPYNSGLWISIYYDAIQLWEVGSGGHHRLLSHILFGSNKINPYKLTIFRNDFVDPLLNESLCQFDKLFNKINFNHKYYIELAFNARTLSEESTVKIKNFFCDVKADEEVDIVRCINAIKKFPHEYILGYSGLMRIEIDNMYRLLGDIRNLRSKPRWYRKLLILKQKFLGIRTVDSITCSVLHLATWDKPYWNNSRLNDQGLLYYLPGLRELLLALFK